MFEKHPQTTAREATAWPLDVRRLAALDLHGWSGARRRRRLIMFEFISAAAVGLGLGLWVLVTARNPVVQLFGIAMAGIGCNYVALTLHALRLCRRGALSAELVAVDLGPQLRRYTFLSLWLLVPFLVAALSVVQRRR